MMHGHEKSDSVIVAVKPANKAEHSAAEQSTAELFAAEPVEPCPWSEGGGSSPLRSGQPATGGTRYSMEGGSLRLAHFRSDLGGQCRLDAGGQALRARQMIQAFHLCDWGDQGRRPWIHAGFM